LSPLSPIRVSASAPADHALDARKPVALGYVAGRGIAVEPDRDAADAAE